MNDNGKCLNYLILSMLNITRISILIRKSLLKNFISFFKNIDRKHPKYFSEQHLGIS